MLLVVKNIVGWSLLILGHVSLGYGNVELSILLFFTAFAVFLEMSLTLLLKVLDR